MWAVYGEKKKISIVFSSRCTFPQIGITFPQEKSYVSANLYITFPLISPIVSQIKLPVAPCSPTGMWKYDLEQDNVYLYKSQH